MAITDEEWVKMGKMIRDNTAVVLEEVVYPQLVEIEERITKNLKNEVRKVENRLSNKIDSVESNLGNRIDNLAKIVTETKTNHERRIKKLEEEVGIFVD